MNEWQPASTTIEKRRGSCSQRMAVLEAVARASGIPTRVRALKISGRFWYPRFRLTRPFIPRSVLLLWPQFFLEDAWLDFDELYSPISELAANASCGFTNSGESLFEAVDSKPIDWHGKTCGLPCSQPGFDLSRFVVANCGVFDTRDAALKELESFQYTVRGRAFELILGDRKSS